LEIAKIDCLPSIDKEQEKNSSTLHHRTTPYDSDLAFIHNSTYTHITTTTTMWPWHTLTRWWESLWQALGFMAGRSGQLLVLGLDNAGKTTLLHAIRTGTTRTFPPTDRPSVETLVWKNSKSSIQFTAWDLGGHEAVRHLWEDYVSTQVSAILFVVDASDGERLEEAGYELDHLMHSITQNNHHATASSLDHGTKGVDDGTLSSSNDESIPAIPLALLLNKCDLPEALPSAEILQKIDFLNVKNYQEEKYLRVFRISAIRNEGYAEAFQWISTFLR
jgi:GTP-binding protein SAR1